MAAITWVDWGGCRHTKQCSSAADADEWRRRLVAHIDRRPSTPPLDTPLEDVAVWAREYDAWRFSDPAGPQGAQLSTIEVLREPRDNPQLGLAL